MPRRPWATASGRNARNQAQSASIWSRWRLVMHRSSESIAAIATALAKAQTELSNPENTMVGIAGEDDLDAPDVINDRPSGDKAAEARQVSHSDLEPTPDRAGQFRTAGSNILPAREKLGTDDSSAIRVQLIQEIETLPED